MENQADMGQDNNFGNMYPNLKFYRRFSGESDDSQDEDYDENDRVNFLIFI